MYVAALQQQYRYKCLRKGLVALHDGQQHQTQVHTGDPGKTDANSRNFAFSNRFFILPSATSVNQTFMSSFHLLNSKPWRVKKKGCAVQSVSGRRLSAQEGKPGLSFFLNLSMYKYK